MHFVRRSSGRLLALMDGYSYYPGTRNAQKNTSTYRCTMAGHCKAKFTLRNSNHEMIRVNTEHNHAPPRYVVKNGIYTKI